MVQTVDEILSKEAERINKTVFDRLFKVEKLHRRVQQAERAHAIIKAEAQHHLDHCKNYKFRKDRWFALYVIREILRKIDRLELAPPKAYRFIPKYATEEQKADPACWSVMISKPSQQWIDGFIVEELR